MSIWRFKNNLGGALPFVVSILLAPMTIFAADPRAFGALYTIEDLRQNPTLRAKHFELLRHRFENSNFEEVLFVNSPARSVRLTEQNHTLMIEAATRFLTENKSLIPRDFLAERPQWPAFAIKYKNGSATLRELEISHSKFGLFLDQKKQEFISNQYLSGLKPETRQELVRLLAKKNPSVQSEVDLGARALIASPDLARQVGLAWRDISRFDNSDTVLNCATTQMIGEWLRENQLLESQKSFDSLDALNLMYLKNSLSSEMQQMIKDLQMPGKISKNFFATAGYSEAAKDVSLPKGETVVLPMSRWEQMFKGIGPGECIRCSANRFFDAFYPDSLAFAILQDGLELGYIGIYRTYDLKNGQKYWYIDTIQTPGLVSAAGSHVLLDAVLARLEMYAAKDGALLAVASSNWNSINFKENAAILQTRGQLDEREAAFQKSPMLAAISQFVEANEQNHHQMIMFNSGYVDQSRLMYNSLRMNKYWLRVLEPSPLLSNTENDQIIEQINHLPKDPLAPALKYRAYKNQKLDLEKDLGRTQMDRLMKQLLLTKDSASRLRAIKRYSAQDLSFAQVIVQFAIPLLEDDGFKDWLELYKLILPKAIDDLVDMSFAYEISSRLQSPDDFLQFIKISRGMVKGAGLVGDQDRLLRLVVARFSSMLNQIDDSKRKMDFSESVLDLIASSADASVRVILLNQAKTLDEIESIMNLSRAPDDQDLPRVYQALNRSLERVGLRSMSDFNQVARLIKKNETFNGLSYVEKTLRREIEKMSEVDWAHIGETLGPLVRNKESSELLQMGQTVDQVTLVFQGLSEKTPAADLDYVTRQLAQRIRDFSVEERNRSLELRKLMNDENFLLTVFLHQLEGAGPLQMRVDPYNLFRELGRNNDRELNQLITTWLLHANPAQRAAAINDIVQARGLIRTLSAGLSQKSTDESKGVAKWKALRLKDYCADLLRSLVPF